MELFRSFGYKIMSSANRDSMTTSFPIFISSSCFISLARNSEAMLNKTRDTLASFLTLEEMVSVLPYLV
jgi:hypothetical protein